MYDKQRLSKIIESDNDEVLVEGVANIWRECADITDVQIKNTIRRELLIDIECTLRHINFNAFKRILELICRLTHGRDFTYYVNDMTSIYNTIRFVCDRHGEYVAKYIDHVLPVELENGKVVMLHVCNQCVVDRVYTTYRFINEAEVRRGSKYDCRYAYCTHRNDTVVVICTQCRDRNESSTVDNISDYGCRTLKAFRVFYGKKCPRCAVVDSYVTLDKFATIANKRFGDKYIYTKIIHPNTPNDNLPIVTYDCTVCGAKDIQQKAYIHLASNGCLNCTTIQRRKQKEIPDDEIIVKARQLNGERYDYIGLHYKEKSGSLRRFITYVCCLCGKTVEQRVDQHLAGHQCRFCNYHGSGNQFLTLKEPMIFYVVRIDTKKLYDVDYVIKIGITQHSIDSRLHPELPSGVTYDVLFEKVYTPGYLSFQLEQRVLQLLRKKYHYDGNFKLNKTGNNELLKYECCDELLSYLTSS